MKDNGRHLGLGKAALLFVAASVAASCGAPKPSEPLVYGPQATESASNDEAIILDAAKNAGYVKNQKEISLLANGFQADNTTTFGPNQEDQEDAFYNDRIFNAFELMENSANPNFREAARESRTYLHDMQIMNIYADLQDNSLPKVFWNPQTQLYEVDIPKEIVRRDAVTLSTVLTYTTKAVDFMLTNGIGGGTDAQLAATRATALGFEAQTYLIETGELGRLPFTSPSGTNGFSEVVLEWINDGQNPSNQNWIKFSDSGPAQNEQTSTVGPSFV